MLYCGLFCFQWQPMLLVLARAFRENSISFAHMEPGKKLQESLKLFKVWFLKVNIHPLVYIDRNVQVCCIIFIVFSGPNKESNCIAATSAFWIQGTEFNRGYTCTFSRAYT